ncbi:MAG: response regulator transcription factor [Bacteroidales bacterium]|nr:response regulator transcription factor [Bacteroidales bacterium]
MKTETPTKINIVLVDDHHLFRNGVKSVIESENQIEVVKEYSNAEDLLIELESKTISPDIIIADISMGGMSGIELIEIVNQKFDNIKCIVLSMHNSEQFILDAIEKGAKAYLSKEVEKSELIEAIQSVYHNKNYFSKYISEYLTRQYLNQNTSSNTPKTKTIDDISKREKEILCLVANGNTNKEIAEKLNISIRTVDAHKNNIMQKLEIKNTVELVKFAIRSKIIEL